MPLDPISSRTIASRFGATPLRSVSLALGLILAASSWAACQSSPASSSSASSSSAASPVASAAQAPGEPGAAAKPASPQGSIFEVPVKTLAGQETTLAPHQGKVLLIVNVASKCGYTRQYPGLQALYERHKEAGLVVLGFPSNDFGGQEPGSDQEIAAFCSGGAYDVTFPMYSKIVVKPGPEQHPLYQRLTQASGQQVSWNFNKFLVGRDGTILKRFDSKVEPDSQELEQAIKAQL